MTTAGFKKGAKMERFERALENPTKALKQIGVILVAESQQAFKNQKLGDKAWDPRAPVNAFGILADFDAGKTTPPSRRFDTRPALKDTGRLAKSIAFRIAGSSVTVGSNLEYASVHHKGGEVESVTITKDVRQALGNWLLKVQDDRVFARMGKYLNSSWIGKKDKMEVPERPIVGITDQTIEDVEEIVGVTLFEAK